MIFIFFGERRRRLVGVVRIEEMHPHEVRPGAVLVEPGFGVLDDLHAAALDAIPALFILSVSVFCVVCLASGGGIGLGEIVVEIEAAIEAGGERVAVENHGSDEGGGLVAMLLQQLGG